MSGFSLRPALALVALVACGGPAQVGSTPAHTGVESYLEALRGDDPRAAYALLDADTRADVNFREFERLWNETRAERAAQVEDLREGLRGATELGERAVVTYPDGKKVMMIREGGAWRLSSGLITRTHAGRPHDAVEIFATALAERDVRGVLRILTSRRREGITRQLDSFVESLQEHLGDASHEIYLIGSDRAELKWRDGGVTYKIILRAEDGEWRVDDVHLVPESTNEDDGADGGDAAEPTSDCDPNDPLCNL